MASSGKLSTVCTALCRYWQTAYSKACDGFRGNYSATDTPGRRSMICAWISSVLPAVLTVLPNVASYGLWLFPLAVIFFFLALGRFFKYLNGRTVIIPGHQENLLKRSVMISLLFFIFFSGILRLTGVNIMPDSQWQWAQVQSGVFDDWHPVIHTFTLYLFSRIHNSEFFAACCQCALFSGCCGWFYYTLHCYGFRKRLIVLFMVILAISPVTIGALRTILKDCAFMIALFAIGIAMMNLWYSRGKWLEKWQNRILLAFLLVYASFVRHNGIFFTVPFILLLPMIAENKKIFRRILIFSGVTLLLCGIYMGSRSAMLKHNIIRQDYKGQSFHEAVGIPLSMMAYAYMKTPEKLPDEVNSFMSAGVPREVWEMYYTEDLNSLKFKLSASLPGEVTPQKFLLMGDVKPLEFAKLFFMSLQAAPRECLYEFFRVTSVAWYPLWDCFSRWQGRSGRVLMLTNAGWLLAASGLSCLIMMIFALYLLPKRGKKILFLVLPFLAYNYGTALMLFGWDHRFFWGIVIGSLPVIVLLTAEAGGEKSE